MRSAQGMLIHQLVAGHGAGLLLGGAQFFKALRYRNLKPAEQDTGTVPRDEVVFEHTLG